eukprot:GHVR01028366.1.p1 GENE.GHVR01028366.1~~GHVR01028366.1.p1  ORF type:complete len:125 (+),score=3.30 GHVR01028366.1:195-569(+)
MRHPVRPVSSTTCILQQYAAGRLYNVGGVAHSIFLGSTYGSFPLAKGERPLTVHIYIYIHIITCNKGSLRILLSLYIGLYNTCVRFDTLINKCMILKVNNILTRKLVLHVSLVQCLDYCELKMG